MAEQREPRAITTLVCVTCGAEQFFDARPPATARCTKCQGTVFREFTTPTERDEVTIARLEESARSIQYGDSSPQTSPDEVRDLNA